MTTDKPTVPSSINELGPAIQSLIDGVSDPTVAYGPNTDSYGKCVEAMWRAAYIAHEAVARELGVTGFQHSVSSLTLLAALRGWTGPVMVLNGEDVLYPQYDLVQKTRDWLESDDVRTWLANEADKRLDERTDPIDTLAEHWFNLRSNRPAAKQADQ